MSISAMSAVWSLDLPDSDKIVLLALADCANDEGHCWPSVASLVRKCSKSERTIQGSIKRLEAEGHLTRREVVGKGCNYTVHPNHKRVDTGAEIAPRSNRAPAENDANPRSGCGQTVKNPQSEAKASLERVVEAWNVMAKANGLGVVRVMDASRKQSLRLRIKTYGLEMMLEAVDIIGRSDWLKGKNRNGNWRPTIDFILQPESLRKLLEGAYGGDPAKPHEAPKPLTREQLPNAIAFWQTQGNAAKVAELEAMLAQSLRAVA